MFLAAVEIDKIQELIFQADKLKEMMGTSRLIAEAGVEVDRILKKYPDVRPFWPVSGVFQFRAEELPKLAACLWEITGYLSRNLGLSVTTHIQPRSEKNSFSSWMRDLEIGMRKAKASKNGEDGTPCLPPFAPCSLLPCKSANIWDPNLKGQQNRRRALISYEASVRKPDERGLPVVDFDPYEEYGMRNPHDFDDITIPNAADSYIAFIKADGDGLGKFLAHMQWDTVEWPNAPNEPHLKASNFAKELGGVFRESLKEAIKNTISGQVGQVFPMTPILFGGEDLWIICRRDLAFNLVKNLSRTFQENGKQNEVVYNALKSSGIDDPLTMSFGILFAQKGYPFAAQAELVNELIKNAKAYRRSLKEKEGCVDFHWLEASGRSTVREFRESGYCYQDNKKGFMLFTRPWTISELETVLSAVKDLKGIARNKLMQWRQVLRAGGYASCALAHRWVAGLSPDEQVTWQNVVECLSGRLRPNSLLITLKENASDSLDPGFWYVATDSERRTSILDLMEVLEITSVPNGSE
ncbi:MAG: hypothetical protein AAGU11_07145 [Syntrophobacteraceae bacterium]